MVRQSWAVAALVGFSFAGWACDTGTVRDAGFHGTRDVFRLNVVAPRGDVQGDASYRAVEEALRVGNGALNIAPARIETDAATPWSDYGLDGPPSHFPVTTLTGTVRGLDRVLFVDRWDTGLSVEDLAALTESPMRTQLAEAVLNAWAVLLYSPGSDAPPDRAAVFDRIAKRWAVEQSPGVTVMTLDRNDPRERTLRAFAGLEQGMPDWLGIVFGKGRLLLSPLMGDKIAEESIDAQLQRLAVQCTCMQDATVHSVSVPMRWDPTLDKRIPAFVPRLNLAASTPPAAPEPRKRNNLLVYVLAPIVVFGVLALAATSFMIRNSAVARGKNAAGARTKRT